MQAWDNFIKQQEKELGAETVNKWLRPLKILRFDACNLYIEAKDTFQIIWFEEHIRQKVQASLVNNNNKKIRVHLALANSEKKLAPKKNPVPPVEPPPKFSLAFEELDPHCTFSSFHPSDKSLLPYKLLCKLCGFDLNANSLLLTPADLGAFNPIYIHGVAGTGKTHLLMATAQALRSNGLKVLYTRADTFTEHVISAIRAAEMSTFRQAYRNIDVLIVDDTHVFSRKTATQEEFFHTFNTLHLAGKQIILSANCSPAELQFVEPRLVSRFEWGIVLQLGQPSKEDLLQILKKKMECLRFILHSKVEEFLLENFPSNPKSICKALEALVLRSHMQQKGITPTQLTVPLVKHYLADLVQAEQNAALTPQKIIQTVADHYVIRTEDLVGKAQTREHVLPRQMAMYFCRNKLKMPFVKIGDLFSKDHSTVMSSVKVIQKAIEADDKEIVSSHNSIMKKF